MAIVLFPYTEAGWAAAVKQDLVWCVPRLFVLYGVGRAIIGARNRFN